MQFIFAFCNFSLEKFRFALKFLMHFFKLCVIMVYRRKQMIITDIQIKNYKSILDSNKIHLEDKLTILIGKNESGKSNLLQAIRDINCLQDNVKIYPYHNRDYPPQITLNVLLTEKEKSFFLNKYGVNISVAVIYIEIGDKFSVELERDIWDEIEKPFINDFKNQTESSTDLYIYGAITSHISDDWLPNDSDIDRP